jgi:DNA-directed RNA polymerase specialized sigma24 family protein
VAASVEEIERVYRVRYAPFARATAALLGDEQRAHDAVQEGFAHALTRRRQFRGGSLEAWVWKIVVRRRKTYDGGPSRAWRTTLR